ncbi:hypothetical protein IHE45_19G107100 [Dioscorea alata]|uniref:Uncharacterized protein n=1 Tax=Dioscorea alata TaxID=55571 RepID=A0ACB7U0L5_DIOAL|nr:hypothetical protein IHE45_19G107100 [Dioscorea alata]
MGRHPTTSTSTNTTTLHSSIALLQERFRQLQRMKELREERELMKMFVEAGKAKPNVQLVEQNEQQPSLFLHPDLLHPSKFEHDLSHVSSNFDTSLSIGLWPYNNKPATTTITSATTNNVRETSSYVDTSLHL